MGCSGADVDEDADLVVMLVCVLEGKWLGWWRG